MRTQSATSRYTLHIQSDSRMIATVTEPADSPRRYSGYAEEDTNYHFCINYMDTQPGLIHIDWKYGAMVQTFLKKL